MLNRSKGSVSGEPSGFVDKFFCFGRSLVKNSALALVASAALVSGASAETLLMPARDARTTAPVVVWGVHTQPAGTPCALSFGDEATTGLPPFNCTGVDRSYIAQAHTYPGQGTYTARLTVGVETTTTTIQVFDPALLIGGVAGDNNRSLGINMAIQDGLRFLWTTQVNRATNFPAGTTTNWSNTSFPQADTSLVVLAFENQGYKITANTPPTGIYEKYIVRRGLNYIVSNLSVLTLGPTPAGNNPCVGVPAPTFSDCRGLVPTNANDRGYTTALAVLGLAGSGALTHVNTEVAGVTNGMTYGEILQRTVNALAWGQNDSGSGRGGWDYGFNSTRGDGSTLGWDILALADANAAGMVVPAWTISEINVLMSVPGGGMLNSDGTWDYVSNGALTNNSVGPAKNGIGLQGLFLVGETTGARKTAVTNAINSWWNGGPGVGGDSWNFGGCSGKPNKGCAYSMFNNFKGLRLQNIATLPGVTRPAGPGAQPAGDWYADYEDWLVANQTSPSTTAGGNWATMGFSSIADGTSINAAIAELILSPVTLVAPDPVLFSTVGLSPATATNPVGGSHTVTAFAQAANNAPIAGVTINFRVVNGPNSGKTGTGNTGADGKTSFTYTDTAGPGTDTIQAFIGATISSNQVLAIWGLACDLNNDGKVSPADLLIIRGRLNTVTTGPTDPYDPNRDGLVNVADMRYCQLRQTATTP